MATAGLRLLQPQQAEDILAACRDVLARGHFLFHSSWAELISGDSEGLYGWIAVNYATGALQVAAQLGAHCVLPPPSCLLRCRPQHPSRATPERRPAAS
jgi:Golgi nucleoside diphosphatase